MFHIEHMQSKNPDVSDFYLICYAVQTKQEAEEELTKVKQALLDSEIMKSFVSMGLVLAKKDKVDKFEKLAKMQSECKRILEIYDINRNFWPDEHKIALLDELAKVVWPNGQ